MRKMERWKKKGGGRGGGRENENMCLGLICTFQKYMPNELLPPGRSHLLTFLPSTKIVPPAGHQSLNTGT